MIEMEFEEMNVERAVITLSEGDELIVKLKGRTENMCVKNISSEFHMRVQEY